MLARLLLLLLLVPPQLFVHQAQQLMPERSCNQLVLWVLCCHGLLLALLLSLLQPLPLLLLLVLQLLRVPPPCCQMFATLGAGCCLQMTAVLQQQVPQT